MLCVHFSFSFYIIVKPRRPRWKSTFNLAARHDLMRCVCKYYKNNFDRYFRQRARMKGCCGRMGRTERRERERAGGDRFFILFLRYVRCRKIRTLLYLVIDYSYHIVYGTHCLCARDFWPSWCTIRRSYYP